ncbi:hypothetical protein ACJX0J_016746 [Zea mays]
MRLETFYAVAAGNWLIMYMRMFERAIVAVMGLGLTGLGPTRMIFYGWLIAILTSGTGFLPSMVLSIFGGPLTISTLSILVFHFGFSLRSECASLWSSINGDLKVEDQYFVALFGWSVRPSESEFAVQDSTLDLYFKFGEKVRLGLYISEEL